jgi:hypothetical protein
MMTCQVCKKEKQSEEFIKNKKCKGGVAATCKTCKNLYIKAWKHKNKERISSRSREIYAKGKGSMVKKRRDERKSEKPIRHRASVIRNGMRDRSRIKNLPFDSDFFSTDYIIGQLLNNPCCKCCGKEFDISPKEGRKARDNSPSADRVDPKKGYTKDNVCIICWRCNKHKQAASAEELRMIADYIDVFGNEAPNSISIPIKD